MSQPIAINGVGESEYLWASGQTETRIGFTAVRAAAAANLGNPGRGLSQTMNMAQAYYTAGDVESACLMLAAFQHQASHAHGKALSQEMSDKLTADSAAVMEALGCN